MDSNHLVSNINPKDCRVRECFIRLDRIDRSKYHIAVSRSFEQKLPGEKQPQKHILRSNYGRINGTQNVITPDTNTVDKNLPSSKSMKRKREEQQTQKRVLRSNQVCVDQKEEARILDVGAVEENMPSSKSMRRKREEQQTQKRILRSNHSCLNQTEVVLQNNPKDCRIRECFIRLDRIDCSKYHITQNVKTPDTNTVDKNLPSSKSMKRKREEQQTQKRILRSNHSCLDQTGVVSQTNQKEIFSHVRASSSNDKSKIEVISKSNEQKSSDGQQPQKRILRSNHGRINGTQNVKTSDTNTVEKNLPSSKSLKRKRDEQQTQKSNREVLKKRLEENIRSGAPTNEFIVGEIVLGTIPGYAPWPARIVKIVEETIFIEFFGTGHINPVRCDAIKRFEINKAIPLLMRKGYKKAILELEMILRIPENISVFRN